MKNLVSHLRLISLNIVDFFRKIFQKKVQRVHQGLVSSLSMLGESISIGGPATYTEIRWVDRDWYVKFKRFIFRKKVIKREVEIGLTINVDPNVNPNEIFMVNDNDIIRAENIREE